MASYPIAPEYTSNVITAFKRKVTITKMEGGQAKFVTEIIENTTTNAANPPTIVLYNTDAALVTTAAINISGTINLGTNAQLSYMTVKLIRQIP